MNKLDLEALGLDEEHLLDLVVDRISDSLLSEFNGRLNTAISSRINKAVEKIADEHILPKVNQMVEEVTLQATNKWGEAKGEPLTFVEYLVERAENYIREEVNYEGKTKEEVNTYGWKGSQTRIAYMIHKYLQYSIERAMKEALRDIDSALVEGIEETVKIKLAEIQKAIKISVKV
jgi:hypothetical protein